MTTYIETDMAIKLGCIGEWEMIIETDMAIKLGCTEMRWVRDVAEYIETDMAIN